MRKLILVIPCYNESQRLDGQAFVNYAGGHPGIRFLFVNDGSTDDTSTVLSGLIGRLPGSDILELPRNVGKGEAVRSGVSRALEQQPDLVGYWDADLATPLQAVSDFCRELDEHPEAEMIFGSRVQLLGRSIQRQASRHYAGRVFATLASELLGVPIYDTQCGAKLFRVTPSIPDLFADPFITRWLFDVEIIARARLASTRAGRELPLREFPLHTWRDVAGSRLRPGDFVRAPFELTRIYDAYLRNV